MTTLLTTCITNLNQKLKKPERKNLTQLDAHGSSDQCCHYIKIKLRFYQKHLFYIFYHYIFKLVNINNLILNQTIYFKCCYSFDLYDGLQ